MKLPDFSYESIYWKQGFTVIGIDEVGRGAFAGPVGVGGVVFDRELSLNQKNHLLSLGINDSKKLTRKKREELSVEIKKLAAHWHISLIPVEIINNIGVGKATFLGMREVAEKLSKKIRSPFLLIDAFKIPGYDNQKGIIRGDSLSISIASASIIAKVERDRLMTELDIQFPEYGFGMHKGYGTRSHRENIIKFGVCIEHRRQYCSKYI